MEYNKSKSAHLLSGAQARPLVDTTQLAIQSESKNLMTEPIAYNNEHL